MLTKCSNVGTVYVYRIVKTGHHGVRTQKMCRKRIGFLLRGLPEGFE
jgi:hypothetical protein